MPVLFSFESGMHNLLGNNTCCPSIHDCYGKPVFQWLPSWVANSSVPNRGWFCWYYQKLLQSVSESEKWQRQCRRWECENHKVWLLVELFPVILVYFWKCHYIQNVWPLLAWQDCEPLQLLWSDPVWLRLLADYLLLHTAWDLLLLYLFLWLSGQPFRGR